MLDEQSYRFAGSRDEPVGIGYSPVSWSTSRPQTCLRRTLRPFLRETDVWVTRYDAAPAAQPSACFRRWTLTALPTREEIDV